MALLFADSFDHYATADIETKWTTNTNFAISANGRNSTSSLSMTVNGASPRSITKTVSPAGNTNTIIIGAAFKCALNAIQEVFSIWDSAVEHVSLSVDTAGVMKVFRGSSAGTLLGTCSGALSSGVYAYIELKVLISDTVGTVEVRVNGSTVLGPLTSQDTRNAGNASWTGIQLCNQGSNTTSWATHYDDLVIMDSTGAVNNDFMGDVRIKAQLPSTGNGSNTDFTPSTGTDHGALVDEATPNTSDYNSSNTAGQRDTYNYPSLGLSGTVKAVQTVMYWGKSDGGIRTVAPVHRISGVNYDGTAVGIGTAFTYFMQVYETSPATAAAWTTTEINSTETGGKVVT